MAVQTMAVSEVRRRLPQIVKTIAEEGGRVDVTVRGQARVSIVRTSDAGQQRRARRTSLAEVLRVEFVVPPEALVARVRELRARIGRPRAGGTLHPRHRRLGREALRR